MYEGSYDVQTVHLLLRHARQLKFLLKSCSDHARYPRKLSLVPVIKSKYSETLSSSIPTMNRQFIRQMGMHYHYFDDDFVQKAKSNLGKNRTEMLDGLEHGDDPSCQPVSAGEVSTNLLGSKLRDSVTDVSCIDPKILSLIARAAIGCFTRYHVLALTSHLMRTH
jgi:hypothetical protein